VQQKLKMLWRQIKRKVNDIHLRPQTFSRVGQKFPPKGNIFHEKIIFAWPTLTLFSLVSDFGM